MVHSADEGGASMVTDSNSQTTSVFARPWAQLIIGIICMVMIANLQYGWTLFVGPIGDKYHWGKAAIQVTFTIFVLFETWLVPAEGYLVDRFGPKWMIVCGGVLCGRAWTITSFGAGSAATIIPIANMIKSAGYEHTFLTFGLFQGIVVVVVGLLILAPSAS